MINVTNPCEPFSLKPFEVKRALVLVPHPDDEVIGCGGLLASLAQLGVAVRVVLVSDGSGAGVLPDGTVTIRFKEFLASLEVLGASISYEAWQLPDGRLTDYAATMNSLLLASLDNFEPSLLIAPWLYDLHPDHAAVGQLAVRIHKLSRLEQGVLFYEVWSPVPANCFLNITNIWPKKMAALHCHKTALKYGNYIRAMQGLAAYRSLLSGRVAAEGEYAEAFFALDWAGCIDNTGARYATSDDAQQICNLHREVFSSLVELDWWQWKYASAKIAGAVFESQGRVVGFYGVIEGVGLWQGEEVATAQLADVMVAAKHRFATRGKSVFSRISRLIFEEHLGKNKRYKLCFGFPTQRALKLGIRLGYYQKSDEIFFASRPVGGHIRLPLWVHTTCVAAKDINDFSWLDNLSVCCPAGIKSFVIKKNAAYWQWRFAEHVEKHYEIIRVWCWGRLIGAAVVLSSDTGLELIDFSLKNWQYLGLLQKAIEKTCLKKGLSRICIWGTQQVLKSFSIEFQAGVSNLAFISLNNNFDSSLIDEIEGNCWLIGGDTDFR